MPSFDSTHFYSVPLGCTSPRTTKPTLARLKGCREKEAIFPKTVPVITIQHHSPETRVFPSGFGYPRLCQSRGLPLLRFRKEIFHVRSLFDPQQMVLSREGLETLEDRALIEEADQQKCDFKGYRWLPILPPQLSIQYAMRNISCHTVSAAMMFCQNTWDQVTRTEASQNKPFLH